MYFVSTVAHTMAVYTCVSGAAPQMAVYSWLRCCPPAGSSDMDILQLNDVFSDTLFCILFDDE